MTKISAAPFQVRYLPFEFENKPNTYKNRPVVVCNVFDAEALVLVAKVTSHSPRIEFPGEILLEDWAAEGLSKPSVVRCSKVATVPIEDLENAPLIGMLTQKDALAVALGLLEAESLRNSQEYVD